MEKEQSLSGARPPGILKIQPALGLAGSMEVVEGRALLCARASIGLALQVPQPGGGRGDQHSVL